MFRYPEVHRIQSPLDPFGDALRLIEYLTARDYLQDLLAGRHGIRGQEADRRVKAIVPHVRNGIALVRQALASDPETSFLTAYYGILHLAKVYVLMGPHWRDLETQRYHGVSYPVNEKRSHNLLTEYVDLKHGGALPLLYRTITGSLMPETRLRMRDVYPYVKNIEVEYTLAGGSRSQLCRVRLGPAQGTENKKGIPRLGVHILRSEGDTRRYTMRNLKALVGLKRSAANSDLFLGPRLTSNERNDPRYQASFRRFLFYDFDLEHEVLWVPISARRLLIPEELPIFLLFFHMASVVRYKPDFLERIRASRYWPLLAAARQHSLLRMLVLAWSFFHQQSLSLRHG